MRNAVNVLSFISLVTQTIGVDDLVLWIGKQWEIENAFAVRRDLAG